MQGLRRSFTLISYLMNKKYFKLLAMIPLSGFLPELSLFYITKEILSLNKKSIDDADSVLEKFALIKKQINNSQEILEQALHDLEIQQKVFYEEKVKAQEYRIFLETNKEKIQAFDNKYKRISKNNNIFSLIIGILLCIFGFFLSKFF